MLGQLCIYLALSTHTLWVVEGGIVTDQGSSVSSTLGGSWFSVNRGKRMCDLIVVDILPPPPPPLNQSVFPLVAVA